MARARCRDCGKWSATRQERELVGETYRRAWAYSVPAGELLLCDACILRAIHEATKDKAA